MINKLKQRKQEGFTIIEVMIVLAIAGLIMVVVFMAVPALQRNSRNTSIKSDAQVVAGAFSDYQGVNNGGVPTGGTIGTGAVNLTGGTGTNPANVRVNGATTGTVSTTATMPGNATYGVINVRIGSKCNAAGTDVGDASTRAAAIMFRIEAAGNANGITQCIEA